MSDRTARDEGWGMLPILLVIALLLGGGYMLYRNFNHVETTTTRSTETQPSNAFPSPSTAPMTPAPTAPKQP